MTMNEHLAAILDIATHYQQDPERPNLDEPEAALRYAVLDRIEDDLGLPVLVKYGDAQAVRREHGQSNDRVWGAKMPEGWTLFRVEPEEDLHIEVEEKVASQFLAIGAWYTGMAEPEPTPQRPEYQFLWPDDHPVLWYLPSPPSGPAPRSNSE